MSVINHLLPLSLNYLPWVIAGLLSWVFAYWQLYKMSDTFADVVTLLLSVLPIGIAIVSFNVMAARWSGKHHYEAWIFLALGVVSLGYFLWLYASQTKVRQVLKDRGVKFPGSPTNWDVRGWKVTYSGLKTKTPGLIAKILLGAISVLASVTLLIIGGWELIQGSAVIIGLILASVGGLTLLLDRRPKFPITVFGHNWNVNVFEVTYSALTEGKVSSGSETAGASSATATV